MASTNSHSHGTRFNSQRNTGPDGNNIAQIETPAAQLARDLIQIKFNKQQQERKSLEAKAARAVNTSTIHAEKIVKMPNLTESDRLVLYNLIEIHQPIGCEMWKLLTADYNKTQPMKRDWKALKKHYNDTVRRALMKPPSGHSQDQRNWSE